MDLVGTVKGAPLPRALEPGAKHTVFLGPFGATITQPAHSDHFLANYYGQLFEASVTGQTTTVGTATTYTGLCVSNPLSSGVLLVINDISAALTVAAASAGAIGVMCGYNSATNVTHTTPLTTRSMNVGSAITAIGLADSSATLPTTPYVVNVMGYFGTAAITGALPTNSLEFDFSGSIILQPGAYCAIYTSVASGASSLFASMQWEEVTGR